jgi:ATP-dependent DNA helicase RecQ
LETVLYLDLEADPKTNKVNELAVVYGVKEFKGHGVAIVSPWLQEAEFICGHNIIAHDIPLLEIGFGLIFSNKNFIDTLLWSPLLFPARPYHSLSKEYKGFSHRDENNPVLDAKISAEYLHDFVIRFTQLDSKWQSILLKLLANHRDFGGFLNYIKSQPTSQHIEELIKEVFDGKVCSRVNWEFLITDFAVELSYALALIQADQDSILSRWVLNKFPQTQFILDTVRFKDCKDINCHYCQSKLSPKAALSEYFGYADFRYFLGDGSVSLQEKAVTAELRNDSFISVFPTGGGKSLTFQLPAMMRGDLKRELTVVISPLVSLMKDQVDVLETRHHNVKAVFISSLLSVLEREQAIDRVVNGGVHLLYVSPESLRSATMFRVLKSRKIARFVIDEAHCFSAWGQDFRVDYLFIGDFIKKLQENRSLIPVSCFTATAKPQVIQDIKNYFKSRLDLELLEFVSRAERVNLAYTVVSVSSPEEKLEKLILLVRDSTAPTIIYCSRIRTVLAVANILQKSGIPCTTFHGKLEKDEKVKNQNDFMQDRVDVIVATSAFGMGVDKSDVQRVIHFDISDSLENYIQEAGRAGRDDKIQAQCFILFNEEDLNKHFALLQNSKLNQKEIAQIWRAIKNQTRLRDRLSQSAFDLAKAAGWETDVRDLENKVTASIAALEDRGYIKRTQNNTKIYANSLTIKKVDEAVATINHANGLTDKQKENCARVIQRLIKDDECQIDYIANTLGLKPQEVQETVELLRSIGVLDDRKDLTAFLDVSRSRKNAETILLKMLSIEHSLLNILPIGSKQFVLRELNQQLINSGIQSSEITEILTVFVWWEKLGYISKTRVDRDRQIYKLKWNRTVEEIKLSFENRKALSGQLIKELKSNHAKQSQESAKQDFAVEFSILELKKAIENDLLNATVPTTQEVEKGLLYLNHIHSIKLEGGFMVFHKRYNIERINTDNYSQYNKEDYAKLSGFYKHKTQQIHIVGEYAKRCITDYRNAMKFISDYFSLEYTEFLAAYFPRSKQRELRRPMTAKRFGELFGGLDVNQLNVVKAESDQILVAAGPGSGKTEVLVRKIASLLTMEDVKPEQFLMLTFSKAAALEFRTRVFQLIPELGRFIKIATFHGFCFEMLGQLGDMDKIQNVIELTTKAIENEELDLSLIANKSVLLLDEFQDVNKIEWKLISAIRKKTERLRIIAVGDDDQNIYKFRGSDIKYMQEFLAEPETERFDLLVNYRSKDNIVELCNEIIQKVQTRIKSDKLLTSGPSDDGFIKIVQHSSNHLIEPLCNDLTSGNLNGTIAVLTATNNAALTVSSYLKSKGVDAQLVAGLAGFNLSKLIEIRTIDKWLIEKRLPNGILTLDGLLLIKVEVEHQFAQNPLLNLCISVLDTYINKCGPRYHYQDWRSFIQSINMEDAVNPQDNKIYVSTMHKSKGKQFDHVFILLDNFKLETDEHVRLLYVAATRAKYTLVIHENNGLFADLGVDLSIHRERDTNPYAAPKEIEVELNLGDVQLDLYNNPSTVNLMSALKTGDELKYGEIPFASGIARGLHTVEGRNLILFSKRFQEKLQKLESLGYKITNAKVAYVIYWFNDKIGVECKVPLARIRFEKDKNH